MASEKPPINGVIFDLDETLAVIDTDWEAMRSRIRALYAKYNIDLEFRPVLQHIEQATEKISLNYSFEKAQSLRSQALSIIEEVALEGAKSAEPLEGAHEILQTSQKLGLKIGILSRNTRKSVLLTIKKCKFEPFIDVVIAREDCEKVKPDSLPVIETVKRLGINPQETLFVGDHPYDVLAGKGAGVLTIAVSTGFPSKEDLAATNPDYLRSNLAEAKTLIISLVTKNE